jgi:hypothetical protein
MLEGTPFVWSIAVAAAIIAYGIYAIRKKDERDPLYGGSRTKSIGQNGEHRF